jgi:spore coat polysaccharide biosynthesis predicted glycosyltransferase SpsG
MDVKRGPILFRCDGTAEGGWEPLYQCLSLAAALQRRRRGTHFFSYLDPLNLAQTIHRQNNEWTPAEQPLGDPNDLSATLREVRRRDAAAVVLAGAAVDEEYMNAVRGTGALVIAIDSSAKPNFQADVVVNPMLAPGPKAYRHRPGTQLLLGRKYALVRGLFRRQRTIRAIEQPAPYRALVAMGDDDCDQTLLRAKQLLDVPKVEKVSLVVRAHHPNFDDLADFAADNAKRVELVTEVKEIMTRLVRCHFAVTCGDAWALELACVGIPQLLLPSKPAHATNAKKMDDMGVATLVGPAETATFEQLAEAVGPVLEDPMERLGMSRCARNLVDGRGGDRIVNGMEILLRTPGRAMPAARAA